MIATGWKMGSKAYRDQRCAYPGIGNAIFEAMDEQDRRAKLKAFLRARREALRPEAVGLESDLGGARRDFVAKRLPPPRGLESRGTRGSSRGAASSRRATR